MQTADTLEQGKWLSVLIKESGCGSIRPPPGGVSPGGAPSAAEYTYMDEDEVGEAPVASAEDDDVYDEVYENRMSPLQIIAASGAVPCSGNRTHLGK